MNRQYWDTRYKKGGDSGEGSKGIRAQWKADILNNFVRKENIKSVIEFGCGDGLQLLLSDYQEYLGVDISNEALKKCRERINKENYSFIHLDEYNNEKKELSLSLEVIFHLIDDKEYNEHINYIFNAAEKWVIIFSSNIDMETKNKHVKHRMFTRDIPYGWKLYRSIESKDLFHSDMYIYRRSL